MDLSQNKLRDGLTNRRLLSTSLHVFDYMCLLAYMFVQGLFNSAVRGTPYVLHRWPHCKVQPRTARYVR